ncbi:MAG: hypothetical protein LUG86_05065 [Oscillospiraceae bacterium]|nr:hypothetical protein [Oscillospiraceae bacterium]
MSGIKLIAGVSVNADSVKKEYKIDGERLILTLSAEDYKGFFRQAIAKFTEPMFFFIEIPDGDSDEYLTYYLNCTVPVAKAILKRYGGILFADGIIRFGFGSDSGDEIYMQEFQHLEIYSTSLSKFEPIVKSLGYKNNPEATTIWDVLSDDTPGMRECVEVDDESFEDIIENLTEVGLYFNA